MSMSDPIADMLIRIANAQAVSKREVEMPSSKMKVAVSKVLEEEGYIRGHFTEQMASYRVLCISLKYFENKPVISRMRRVSRPGLRIYRSSQDLPQVMGGFGITVVSTPRGVMSGRRAQIENVGGEVLCTVE